MAVNFGILQPAQPVSAFFQGQQDVQQAEERNALRKLQMEQMGMERENLALQRQDRQAKLAAAAERQRFLSGLSAKMAEGGYKLDRPTLGQMLQFGMQTGEDNLVKLATEGMRALDEEDMYARETMRLGIAPGAAPAVAPSAAPANALTGAAPSAAPANALAGGYTREQVQQMVMSPSARLSAQGRALAPTLEKPETPPELIREYNFAKSQGYKGSLFDYRRDMAAAIRTPEKPDAALDPRRVVNTITDAAGNVRMFNVFGQEISPATAPGAAPVKGKPSATFEKTRAQREQLSKDLDTAIFELKNAAKDGGLIDQSTGSGVGRAIDVGARVFGTATEGDIAIGKLKPIADVVLKMVPRFEGPQSDKDTQSYKEAAGQLADPGLPRAIRKAAAQTIIRLMENRKGQFVSSDMASEGVGAAGGVDVNNPLLK